MQADAKGRDLGALMCHTEAMSDGTDTLTFEHAALKIELVAGEHDEALGAFRAEVKLSVEHDTGALRYEARDIWVPRATFEAFATQVEAIAGGSDAKATLADMSEFLVWELWREDELLAGELQVDEPVPGTGETRFRFELEAPLAVAKAFGAALAAFPRPY